MQYSFHAELILLQGCHPPQVKDVGLYYSWFIDFSLGFSGNKCEPDWGICQQTQNHQARLGRTNRQLVCLPNFEYDSRLLALLGVEDVRLRVDLLAHPLWLPVPSQYHD